MAIPTVMLLLSLSCVPAHGGGPEERVAGISVSSDKSLAGRPCVGVAKMLPDGTLIYYFNDELLGLARGTSEQRYEPRSLGYKGAISVIGGIEPGQEKVIPPPAPSVGVASMSEDGTLSLDIRNRSPEGPAGEGLIVIKPGDPRYDKLVEHIGIKPGEVKPMPPWELTK